MDMLEVGNGLTEDEDHAHFTLWSMMDSPLIAGNDLRAMSASVRATLANPEGKLLPGMFASLQVMLPDPQQHIVVPESTITYTLYGNSLYVVGQKKAEDGTLEKDEKGQPILIAERRFIETGERRDGLVMINNGVQSGEQVVTAGQIKLDNGAHIAISADKTLTDKNSQPRTD